MGLLRVPRATSGRAQPVHRRDDVEQARARQVPVAVQDLELEVVAHVARLSDHLADRASDIVVAVHAREPCRYAGFLSCRPQQPRKGDRGLLGVDGLNRNACGFDREPVRVVLVAGEDRPGAKRGPGVPRQRSRSAARAGDEQNEAAHAAIAGQGPGDGDGELTASFIDGATTVPRAKSHTP